MKTAKKKTSVYLEIDVYARLLTIARAEKRSVSAQVEYILQEYEKRQMSFVFENGSDDGPERN